MTTSEISAVFNGQNIIMKIHSEDLPHFEIKHGPAYALYNKFSEGRWTVSDVFNVIKFALSPRPDLSKSPTHIDVAAMLHGRFGQNGIVPHPKECPVKAALKNRPVAQYAILAQLILGGVLFGLDPSEANFSDGSNG